MDKSEYSYWMALAHLERMFTSKKIEILVKCYQQKLKLSEFFINKYKSTEFNLTYDEVLLIETAKEQIPNYAFMAEGLLNQGYKLITIWDLAYPQQLKKSLKYNSPILLYAKGNINLLQEKIVAIVGSRKANETSLLFTDNIARTICNDNNVIVSGYAKGVDQQALLSAIATGGKSIVILPQGITTFNSGYKKLYPQIINGDILIISYFHPNAGWDVGLAMARNNVIYGLANKIYVAESDHTGGTWNGVNQGLTQQRKNNDPISIYVRVPNKDEKNANLDLISLGAVPVDIKGNILNRYDVVENLDQIETNIINLLKGRILRPEEIITALNLQWDKKQIVKFIENLKSPNITKCKKGRYNCYTIEEPTPTLFS